MPRARAAGPVLRRPATHPLSAHAEAWRGGLGLGNFADPASCKSVGRLNLSFGSQPALYLGEHGRVGNRRGCARPFPDRIHPGPDLFGRKKVSLPADRQRASQHFKPILKPKIPTGMRDDVDFPRPLDLGVSAHASRVTKGRRRCRSVSLASSFRCMAKRQIGREKQDGMSSAARMGLYSKPAATRAASLMQVPPSLPGKGCEPCFSFQFRRCAKLSMAAIFLVAPPATGWWPSRTESVNHASVRLQNCSSAHEPRSAERPHLREQCRLRWGSLSGHDERSPAGIFGRSRRPWSARTSSPRCARIPLISPHGRSGSSTAKVRKSTSPRLTGQGAEAFVASENPEVGRHRPG